MTELFDFWKANGLKKTIALVNARRLQRKMNRMGGLSMLFHTDSKLSYSLALIPNNDLRELAVNTMAELMTHSLVEDKNIHDIMLKGVADYLRPLTVEKKIFIEILNENKN